MTRLEPIGFRRASDGAEGGGTVTYLLRQAIARQVVSVVEQLVGSRRAKIDWRLMTDDDRIKLRKFYPSTDGKRSTNRGGRFPA